METLDAILTDWRECRPQGVVLRASRLEDFLVILRKRAGGLSRDVEAFLVAVGPEPLPFIRHFRVSADRATGAQQEEDEERVVHFMKFWMAMQEFRRRLHPSEINSEEPFMEEVASFRDALLRAADDDALTCQFLVAELRKAKKTSSDEAAWSELEADVEAIAPQWQMDIARTLPLDQVSTLLLAWLTELAEDYLRGKRGEKIRIVCAVLGCQKRAACLHLSACSWEVEAALESFQCVFLLHPLGPTRAWSSKSVREEVQCGMCANEYSVGLESVATRCCVQAMCVSCVTALTDLTGCFRCPFCRGVTHFAERVPPKDRDCDSVLGPFLDPSSFILSRLARELLLR